jgi:hypothetical protein
VLPSKKKNKEEEVRMQGEIKSNEKQNEKVLVI